MGNQPRSNKGSLKPASRAGKRSAGHEAHDHGTVRPRGMHRLGQLGWEQVRQVIRSLHAPAGAQPAR